MVPLEGSVDPFSMRANAQPGKAETPWFPTPEGTDGGRSPPYPSNSSRRMVPSSPTAVILQLSVVGVGGATVR